MKRATTLLALGAALAGGAPAALAQFPTTPPALGPGPAVSPPEPVTRTLANGMKVTYVRMPELPVVSAALVIRGAGTTEDPAALPGLVLNEQQLHSGLGAGRLRWTPEPQGGAV